MRRDARKHPAAFRRQIRLQPEHDAPQLHEVQPAWQAADLSALDDAWCLLAGRDASTSAGRNGSDRGAGIDPLPDGRDWCESAVALLDGRGGWESAALVDVPPIRRAYIERARGHAKTADMAIQIAWILLAARTAVTGLAAAADQEQAGLLHEAVRKLSAANPGLLAGLQFFKHEIRNPQTGSVLRVMASDVRSSWGQLPDFVICDELCHWQKPQLWESLISSAAKRSHCVVCVLTNAGVGRDWQWEIREHARQSDEWYFASLPGSPAPWIDRAVLREQRALLPPAVYSRLWENEWQASDGQFVTLAEATACRDESLTRQEKGHAGLRYVAAIDYAEKHDLTVGVVCHDDGRRIVVDRMDVVQPKPNEPTLVQWVEDWITDVAQRFAGITFLVDEYQLVGTIQRLQWSCRIERFPFQGALGNHRLALRLRQLIVHKLIAWYPGCGEIVGDGLTTDNLETELAGLLLEQGSNGRLRINHVRDGRHHDDRAFALGAACLHLTHSTGDDDRFTLAPPQMGSFAW